MPYVKKERRLGSLPKDASCGDLNYQFTELIKEYLAFKGESYQTYNDIVGALECCKMELYRRKIQSYEDKKIAENGDVY